MAWYAAAPKTIQLIFELLYFIGHPISFHVIYLLQTFCFYSVVEAAQISCSSAVDVGFIVDSSGSLRYEYSKEKDFIKQLAAHFQISQSGTRAGLVLFSNYASLKIKFSDYSNTSEFQMAVDRLPLIGKTTRIDKALQIASEDMFKEENGMRPSVPKLLILLTDGKQTKDYDAVDASEAVMPLHEAGIYVIVVGIGSGVIPDELKAIVKEQKNLYFAKDFDQLRSNAFIRNISSASCRQTSKYVFCLFFEVHLCNYDQTYKEALVSKGKSEIVFVR